jgi:hypothetical protein
VTAGVELFELEDQLASLKEKNDLKREKIDQVFSEHTR